jgi:hypothetical protein
MKSRDNISTSGPIPFPKSSLGEVSPRLTRIEPVPASTTLSYGRSARTHPGLCRR